MGEVPDDILSERLNTQDDMVEAIVAYFSESPQAMDTFEGIAQWWLVRHRVRLEVVKLANALEKLTADEFLEMVGPRENPCYRLKSKRP